MAQGVAKSEEEAAKEDEPKEDAEQGANAQGELGFFGFVVFVVVKSVAKHHHSFDYEAGGVGLSFFSAKAESNLPSRETSSMGSGKTMVVFFSAPMSVRVCR